MAESINPARDAILVGWDEAMGEISDGVPPKQVATKRGWAWRTFLDVSVEPERAALYARARDAGWASLADEIRTISDDGSNDTYEDKDGRTQTDHDVIARSRLRVDTRKWLLSKMLPKVYGDKVALTGDGGGPIGVQVEIPIYLSSILPTSVRARPEAPYPQLPGASVDLK